MKAHPAALFLTAIATLSPGALAQDAAPVGREPTPVVWSSPEIESIATQLAGSWRTEDPIESMKDADGNTSGVYVIMSVAPVAVEGVPDAMYVESVRSDTPWSPYRRAVFQVYPYKNGLRLRTYEIATGEDSKGVFNGMYAAPEWFPSISRDNLIATMDVDLTPTSDGFTGTSPYPFPTGVGGAVEMTSSVALNTDTLTVADRGYDANGAVAWGASSDDAFVFVRSQSPVTVTRRDDGMVVIDYGGASGPLIENGDRMHVHYEGFLTNGKRFDASYDRGEPFIFNYPPGNRAIAGWGIGMENFAQGARRKLIIPGYLAYGSAGNPRAGIAPDAPLMFNIHFVHADKPEPAPEPAPSDQ